MPGFAGDFSRNASEPIVIALGANATNEIAIVKRIEQFWQVRGIVLEITIEGGDDGRGAGDDPGPKGGALPCIFLMPETTDAGVKDVSFNDLIPGGIGAAVVYKNELVIQMAAREGLADFTKKREHVGFLVVDRHND